MELLSYLYGVALDCTEASKPMVRPLVYQWSEDPLVWDCEDESLLGDSLLVVPLLEESAEKHAVYLSEGQWIGLFDRRAAAGEQTIVAGGDRRLPVFLRAGCGLVLRSDANSAPGVPAGERTDGNAPLHLLLVGGCGRFRLWDELGTDLDITWSDGAVRIEGDYRFLLTWEVLPAEEC